MKPRIGKNLSAGILAVLSESDRYDVEAVGKSATGILDRALD